MINMNKQYFAALYLLVTAVSTSSGMELSRPGMGFSNLFWENVLRNPWSKAWTIIEHADQETKNEVLRQLFTPKFKKLLSKPVSPMYPERNCWVESWNRATQLGANLENVEINLWDIPGLKLVQYLIQEYGAPTDLREPKTGKLSCIKLLKIQAKT